MTEAYEGVRRRTGDEANAESRENRASNKKHPCPDCSYCQGCSEDRCRLCLKRKTCRRKLSLAEQIALYDELNRAASSDKSIKPD